MKKIALAGLIMLAAFSFPNELLAQQISNFSLVNALTDQPISPANYPSCEGLIIIFTTNGCPYDEYYRNRITKLNQTYGERIPVLLVNSNVDSPDTKDEMAKKGKQWNLTIPYLADKDQKLMASLDARKSSEAFLLKNVNGNFVVVYRGAIDDNAQVEADVRSRYLQLAVDALLAKQKIEATEIRPVGCNLKKKL
jgi:hypothetical protein